MKKAYLAGVTLLLITLGVLLLPGTQNTAPSRPSAVGSHDSVVPASVSGEPPAGRQKEALADWDKRFKGHEVNLSPSRSREVTEYKKTVQDATVDFDLITKSPKWIGSSTQLLTGPQAELAAKDADAPIRRFIDDHRALFGHGSEVLDRARKVTDYSTPRGPSRKVVWHQQVDGIDVFEAILQANLTTNSALINIGSQIMPEPEKSLDEATRAALIAHPPVAVEIAVAAAGRNVGEKIPADGVKATTPPAAKPDKRQQFRATMLTDAEAGLVWVPMDEKTLRLAWDVTLTSRSRAEMYRVLVDAQTAEVLVRQALTAYISPASYRVFTQESPSPFSPGHESSSSLQPASISRSLVTTSALDTTASPAGWINDGDNITSGNNTDTYTDTDNSNSPDLPRTTGSPSRVFDFPLDLALAPSNFKDASNTQLFYWTNLIHDRLYQLGFTEAAGNFQVYNFGRGGLASDPVNAEAQDGSGTDNANFSTPVDGSRGRMQMYLWTPASPDRDGCFDLELVGHEYGHGVSNRLVGGPSVTMTSLSSRGMGEGWSDFYGLSLTAEATDNPHGNWAMCAWPKYLTGGWYSENYYYGIRRHSYSSDMLKNPHTFKDIDPSRIDLHTNVPRNPTFSESQDATQVHHQGTVWCAALWDLRTNLIVRHGFAIGNERALFLITEGMKYAPANPNFIQARDGILQATLVNHAEDSGEVWTAFAKRGMGHGATAPASTTTTGVVESYKVPDGLEISDRSGWNIRGNWNSTFTPASRTLTLNNDGSSNLSWTANPGAAWLSVSPSSGTLTPGANVTVTVTTQVGATAPGFHGTNLVFTNTATDFDQPVAIRLYVTPPAVYRFDLSTSPGWTTTGEWALGTPTGGGGLPAGGAGNPDPTSGATGTNVYGVNLLGNVATTVGGPYYLTSAPVDLSKHKKTRLRFMRWLNGNFLSAVRLNVQLSTDGTTWRDVFVNPGTSTVDSAWTLMDYDISSIADSQPSVRVRWGYQNISNPGAYTGWNIDDIEFLGEPDSQLHLSFASTVSEGAAALPATVGLNAALDEPLVVNLQSSQVTAATVPATVTIPAGSLSAPFVITQVNDALLDGSETTLISASAPETAPASRQLVVHDDESAVLTLTAPTSVLEGTQATASVSVSTAPGRDVTVSLTSTSPALVVPASIIIPAGSAGPVTFTLQAPDNIHAGGAKLAVVSASVSNWTASTKNVQVTDDEVPTIVITGPANLREGDGPQTYTASVNTIQTGTLTVSLASDNTAELTVPPTVVIISGQTSATFQATIINDTAKDGERTTTILGSQAGYLSGSRAVSIADNDVASYAFATIPSPQKRNQPISLAVSARDINGTLLPNHIGSVTLTATSASGPLEVTPAGAALFVNGVATQDITFVAAASAVTVKAQDSQGNSGTSNAFDVQPVVHDRFVWSNLPASSVPANTLFSGTVTAVDDEGNVTSNYQDPTRLEVWIYTLERTVGTGSTTTSDIYNTAAEDSRAQMIITNQELGTTPRWIGGISFSLATVGGSAMSNVRLRMKHTDRADFANAGWEGGGWQTVYSSTSMPASSSIHQFDQPFFYDGTRNVMVDFSFDGSTSTTAGTLRYTSRPNRVLYGSSQSQHGDPRTWSGLNGPFFTIGDVVPNMNFYEARNYGALPNSPVQPVGGVWSGQMYTPANSGMFSFWLRALAPSGVMGFSRRITSDSTVTTPVGTNTVFGDSFDTLTLGSAWSLADSTGTTPRVLVTGTNAPKAGNYHLIMDNPNNATGVFARNSPTLTLNLAGRRNVSLEWYAKTFGDETHPPSLTGPLGTFDSSMNYDGVAISQDGTEWVEISALRGLSSSYGTSPTRVVLDQVIQRLGWSFNSTFRLRFSQYDDLSSSNSDGIALDEVFVRADPVSGIALSLPPTVQEGAVNVPFTVSLPSVAPANVTVTLTCTPATRLSTPATVVIPAGQTSVQSTLSAPQNFYTENGFSAVVTAQATGYTTSNTHVRITDDESFTLGLVLPASITEGGAAAIGTVTISPPSPVPTSVFLSTGSPDATVVSHAIVNAGAVSTTFTINAVNDILIDGTQSASITVTGQGMTSATASLDVLDNENPTLTVTAPVTLVEGSTPAVGTVTITGLRTGDTTVNLSSSDVSEAAVPASIIIPTGQTSANFQITPVEDNLQDGAQSVIISATATGLTEGTATVSVRDNDPKNFVFSNIPSPQKRHVPFPLIITAQDSNNQTMVDFSGTAVLQTSGAGSVSTSIPLTFIQGIWNGQAWLNGTGSNIVLSATSSSGASGTSNTFDVTLGGTATALAFAPLPSPVRTGTLLPVQVSAVDADGLLVNEVTGPVTIELRTSPGNAVVLSTAATLAGGRVSLTNYAIPSTASAVYLHATAGALTGQTGVFSVISPVALQDSAPTSTDILFQDGFEAGLRSEWTISGTDTHRTIITNANLPRTGANHLVMDSTTSLSFARNEATLTLDLAGKTGVELRFWIKSFTDEDHGPPTAPFIGGANFDGVAISADGNTWHEVQGLRTTNGVSSLYTQFIVNLSSAAAARGLALNSAFKIRFNHYDDYPVTTDGFAFDDVTVRANADAVISVFQEDFETGDFKPQWQISGTGPHRTVISSTQSPRGAQHLLMDSHTTVAARNEATLSVDLSGMQDAILKFWIKELGDEDHGPPAAPFSQGADFDGVAISADGGGTWYEVQGLRSTNAISSFYQQFTVDLSAAAASRGLTPGTGFKIRFNHYDNEPMTADGFALDDISLTARPVAKLALTAPPTIGEGTSASITVSQPATRAQDTVVRLASSRPARVTLPATVTIPAGQLSATLNLGLPEDALLTGDQVLEITAQADSLRRALASTALLDNETIPGFDLNLSGTQLPEGGSGLNGNVSHTGSFSLDVGVVLTATPSIGLTFPASLTLPAGTTNGSFTLRKPENDLLLEASSTVFKASAGTASESITVTLMDNDASEPLVINLPATAWESDAPITGTVGFAAPKAPGVDLVVALSSSDITALTVPATVTIPAGSSSATVTVTPQPNNLFDGTRNVTLTASASGVTGDTHGIAVRDDDLHHISVSAMASPQVVTLPVNVTLQARTIDDTLLPGVQSSITLSAASGSTPVGITYGVVPVAFTNGVWSGQIAFQEVITNVVLSAATAGGITGSSNSFEVSSGPRVSVPGTVNKQIPEGEPASSVNLSLTNTGVMPATWSAQVVSGTWLTVSPSSGTIPTGGTAELTASFNPAGWVKGSQLGTQLRILSNDPTAPQQDVQVNLKITNPVQSFQWSTVPSPQNASVPFAVTLTAKDSLGATVTDFQGQAALFPGPDTQTTTGTGSGSNAFPFYAGYYENRMQSIFLPAEAGPAGRIRDFEIQVSSIPGTLTNFTVRVKHTSRASYSTTSWENSGWTVLYRGNLIVASTGWLKLPVTGAFDYDGVSNLMVDLSFDNDFSVNTGGVNNTSVVQPRTLYTGTNGGSGDPLLWQGTTPTGNISYWVPNLRLSKRPGVPLSPAAVSLTNGVWSGDMAAQATGTGLVLRAQHTTRPSVTGQSNAFDVISVGALSITSATSGTEGGTLNATLTASQAPLTDLTVQLTSADTSEALVPATVVLPAFQTSVPFTIFLTDDTLLDSTQTALISATAPYYNRGTHTVSVQDNDVTTISVNVPVWIMENNTGTGTVQLGDNVSADMLVLLASNLTSRLTVPAGVIIPAGQSSATFTLTASNNSVVSGDQTATITATLAGSAPGVSTLEVLDNEPRTISVQLVNGTLSEGEPPRTNAAYVSLAGTAAAPLTIDLSSSDTTELTVPASVTIPTGSSQAYFTFTPVNDALYDGRQTVTVTASAATFSDGSANVFITDDEVHRFSISTAFDQVKNRPFTVSITPVEINGLTISTYTGNPAITATDGGAPLPITPTTTGSFSGTTKNVTVTIPSFASAAVITVTDAGISATGSSSPFMVGSGTAASFAWSSLPSPQVAETPFSATLTALDAQGNIATSFAGSATLSTSTEVAINPASGTTSSDTLSSYYPHNRTQAIYKTAELGGAKTFNSLALYVSSVPGSMSSFTIRLKHTPLADFSLAANATWQSAGWTTCYTISPKTISSTGWHVMTFSTPFAYNGTDNLLVDISYANAGYGSTFGYVNEVPATASAIYYQGGTGFGQPLSWSGTSPAPTTKHYRPEIRLGISNGFTPAISPVNTGSFTAGVWTGNVTAATKGTNVEILATSGTLTGRSNPVTIQPAPPRATLALPAFSWEGEGNFTAALTLNDVQPGPVVVSLGSSDTSEVTVPATVTIPANTLSVQVSVTLVNDSLRDGEQNVTVTTQIPGGNSSATSFIVQDDDLNDFQFTTISGSKIRNAPFSVSVKARNIDEQTLTTYSGSPMLSAADGATPVIISAPQSQITGFASGIKTFDVTLGSDATAAVLTLTDGTATGSSNSFAVGPGPHTRFAWGSISSPQMAQVPFEVILMATDDYGNVTPTFSGTATLSPVTLPGPAILPSATGNFSGGIWTGSLTLGSQSATPVSLRAVSGAANGISSSFTVLPPPPQITLTLPATTSESTGTVAGTLRFDNAHPTPYTINLTSSDTTAAQVPASVTMPANTTSIPVTLTIIGDSLKDGAQNVTITATIPSVHTTNASISVLDDELHDFHLAAIPSPQLKNDLFSIIITARSIDGLTISNYTGIPTLTAADGAASLSVTTSGSLGGFVSGQKVVNASISSAAAQAVLTVKDGSATGSSNPVEIKASGQTYKLAWEQIPALQFAGEGIPVTLMAQDALGNTTPGYSGNVSLTAEVPHAIGLADNVNEHPMHTTYERARSQQILLANEIGEAGIIDSLTLNIADAGSTATLTNFTIRIKHTSRASYSATAGQNIWESTGFTTVYQGSPLISGSGRMTFQFSSAFAYDGTSNLIIDYSHSGSSAVAGIGPRFTSTSNSALRSFQLGTNSSASGQPLSWSGSLPAGQTEYRTTDVWLGFRSDAIITPASVSMINGTWTGHLQIDRMASIQAIRASTASGMHGTSGGFTVLGFRQALNPEPQFTGGLTNSLQWSPPAPGLQYQVQRSTTPGFTAPVSTSFSASTQSLHTNLVNGQTYYYRLRMMSQGKLLWLSDWSPTVSSTQDATPPALQALPSVTMASIGQVTGTASDSSGIQSVSIGSAPATSSDGFAHWSAFAASLVTGSNVVTITARDNAVPPNTAVVTTNIVRTGSDQPAAPQVHQSPDSLWAAVGAEVRLKPVVIGSRPMQFDWLKNGTSLPVQGPEFVIPAAKATDAGSYQARITNGQAVALSEQTHLGIFTPLPDSITVKNGGSFKLATTVTVPKEATVSYLWTQTGQPTTDGPRESGAVIGGRLTKSLSVSRVTSTEAGVWHCRMEMVLPGSGSVAVMQKDIPVRVLSVVPVLAAVPSPMEAWVSQPLNLALSATEHPTSYAATGLPAGLVLDKLTGRLSGRVTTASKIDPKTGLPVPTLIKFTASNLVGTSLPVELRLVVKDHFGPLAGTFQGLVDRHPVTNFNHGGLAELTLAKTGVATGSFTLAGQKYSFVTPLDPLNAGSNGIASGEIAFRLPRTKPAPLGDLNVGFNLTPQAGSGWMDDLQFASPAIVHTHGDGTAGANDDAPDGSGGARFNSPQALVIDDEGIVFLADKGNNRIRALYPADGGLPHHVATHSSAVISSPQAVLPLSGVGYYVAGDSAIRFLRNDGSIENFVGEPGQSGYRDGSGSAARFGSISGICADAAGNLYVTDTDNHVIRKITPGKVVTTFAGGGGGSHQDGSARKAAFLSPRGITYDAVSKTLLVADTGNSVIRRVTLAGAVTTVTGRGIHYGASPGVGLQSRLENPVGITSDGKGTFYVTDRGVNPDSPPGIWQISPAGIAVRVAEGTSSDFADHPEGIVFDSLRRVLLVSYPVGNRVEEFSLPALASPRQDSHFTLARTPLATGVPAGIFNASLSPGTGQGPLLPRGIGHASITVSPKAAVSFSGRLPDGQTWTASGSITHDKRFFTSTMLYKGAGSVQGSFVWDPSGSLGSSPALTWLKLRNSLTPPDPLYPGGFDLQLAIAGGLYTPGNINTFLGLAKGPVTLDFMTVGGGIDPISQAFTLTAPATVKVTTPNPNALSFSISPATGLITGKLLFGSPARTANFSGLILDDGSKRGRGHFLLPESTLKNSPTESAEFTLSPR